MITAQDLTEVQNVHFTVGGDHGGGKFRMTLKVLFRFSSKATISRLYQIASVEYSKDSTPVLKSTVLDPIGESLKVMVEGGRFIVTVGEEDRLTVQFDYSPESNGTTQLCSVPTTIVVVGDLKFYAQLLGRENMSGSWCMWCDSHPSQWNNDLSTDRENLLWTIQRLKEVKDKITRGELKQAKDKLGVVEYPIWDFIEPCNYMLPQLHIEIGLTNNVLDNFYDFIDDHVEKTSLEEKVARNQLVMADVAFTRAEERLDHWKATGATDLVMFRLEKSNLQAALRSRRNNAELLAERDELDRIIQALMDERKSLEVDKKNKKKELTQARGAVNELYEKRSKIERLYVQKSRIDCYSAIYLQQHIMGGS
jgi:hypothetical protein